MNNVNMELEIDSFDNLEWYKTVEVKNFTSGAIPKNKVLETFKRIDILPFTNVRINFSDSIWDFSPILKIPKTSSMVFTFNNYDPYCDCIKMYVLNELLKKKTKIRVLCQKFSVIFKFLKYLTKNNYLNYSIIPKNVYEDYFNTFSTSYSTICDYKGKILMFNNFYETTFNSIQDKSIKKFLKDRDQSRLNSIQESNKTPEIPIEYLNSFIKTCKAIMRDITCSIDDRITASIMILYSQIGFRASELLGVKINAIKEAYSPNQNDSLKYLIFTSYKHGDGDNGGTVAHTYINNISYEAYNLLVELCHNYRTKLCVDTLIVTRLQKKEFFSSKSMSSRFRKFMLFNNKKFNCININNDNNDLSSFRIGDLLITDSDGYLNFDLNRDCFKNLSMDDILVIPQIRQFRVSVCTNLYREGVPLNYIKKHMNHLSEDMTSYYIRPEKDIEKKYSETIYTALIEGKSKLLGQHSDEFVNKINKFIETLDVKIKSDVKEVVKMVSNRFPLRSKVGGICIRCGDVIPCASNNSSDEIYCAFGMCPNHCHMFFMADISYEEYLRHKDIIKYNTENGFTRAAKKETNKLIYVIENSLLPELNELKNEIEKVTANKLKLTYPQLSYLIDNYAGVYKEVSSWI